MKAIVLASNGVLEYKDVSVPKMQEDECLVKVISAGICNSDIYRAFEKGAYRYPLIMGHEFSGEIVECGKKVSDLLPGQGVTVFPLIPCFKCQACKGKKWVHCDSYDYYGSRRDGAFAEYISVKYWNLLPVSNGCDLHLAAFTEPLAVSIHALKNIPEEKRGKLLVLGAGFIGLSLAKLVENTGRFAEVWLFDRNKFKLKIAESFGFSTFLIDTNWSINDSFKVYFDVVVEACGAINSFRNSVKFCNNRACLIWLGNIQGDLSFSKKEVSSILRKEITISGVWNSDYQPDVSSDWTEALEVIRSESWIKNLITHCVPLSEGKNLFEDLYYVKKHPSSHSYLKACLQITEKN